MRIKTFHWVGVAIGILVIGISFIPRFLMGDQGQNIFFLLIGIGAIIAVSPFIYSVVKETREAKEKEAMFLEFSRNLVESVKTGTPISKSIINVSNKNYRSLTPHIKKLANQISLGIPMNEALRVFAKDVDNKNVSKAITLIGQAERSGGEIGTILESVAESVSTSERLKKERKSKIQTLTTQGYLVFFIFIVIVLVVQYFVLPMLSGINLGGSGGGDSLEGAGGDVPGAKGAGGIKKEELGNAFLFLLLTQGLFSGLAVGKLSERNFLSGLKHSFILVIMAFMISAIARLVSDFMG